MKILYLLCEREEEIKGLNKYTGGSTNLKKLNDFLGGGGKKISQNKFHYH